jgi:7-cyano-7-deazaguanine synthase in queuosine biosynthesis
MKNYSGPIKVFNTIWSERPNHALVANRVYQKCIDLTGHTDYEIVRTTINESYNEYNLFVTPMDYLKRGKVDYVYTGLTANPTVELKYNEQKVTKRENRREKLIDDNNFYLPFANENKKTIALLYKENNLLESLFPLTFSCVRSKTLEHCNQCWWCEERKWGFNRL